MGDARDACDKPAPPSIFSLRFHSHFLPALLLQRLRQGGPEPVRLHVSAAPVLALVACAAITAAAAPFAMRGSAIGVITAIAGAAGVLMLVTHSVWTSRNHRLTFDAFHVPVFVFFIVLGMTAGLFAARETGAVTLMQLVLCATAGAMIGYLSGVGAGLWTQRLGWFAGITDVLALAASFGLVLLAFVLIS